MSFCSFTKEITPKICGLCFCPNKSRSSEPFICLDLVLERYQSFLFQIFVGPWLNRLWRRVFPVDNILAEFQYFMYPRVEQSNVLKVMVLVCRDVLGGNRTSGTNSSAGKRLNMILVMNSWIWVQSNKQAYIRRSEQQCITVWGTRLALVFETTYRNDQKRDSYVHGKWCRGDSH